MNQKQQLGKNIAKLRKTRGLTSVDLAEMSDISTKTLASIEIGRANPTLNTLQNIANSIGIELVALFTEPNSERKEIILREQLYAANRRSLELYGSNDYERHYNEVVIPLHRKIVALRQD